jgi:hypothetical protein
MAGIGAVGLDEITDAIVSESIAIHGELGRAHHQSVYDSALARALQLRGFSVEIYKV